VGACVYARHPSAEIICAAYDLEGSKLWVPGCPPQVDLFEHVKSGGIIKAWNSMFEYYIWNEIGVKKLGWPPLPIEQMSCTMARARAAGYPGALDKCGKVLNLKIQKDKVGKRLINKFTKGHQPSKKDPRPRIPVIGDPEENTFYYYCVNDVESEKAIDEVLPELSEFEHKVWMLDQKINLRGVHIDRRALNKLRGFVKSIKISLTDELKYITKGRVNTADENKKIRDWLNSRGVKTKSIAKAAIIELLENPLIPPDCRRVLELRQTLSATSIGKLDAIHRRLTDTDRLHDLFVYHGALHTGRWAGRGPQPQNLKVSGPRDNWSLKDVDDVLSCGTYTDLFNKFPGKSLDAIAGCLRSLFSAAPGAALICSDFSAIEAVVLAELAGETWRQEVFRTHGKIYEMSASKISGIPFEDFLKHKEETGEHHPLRKKIGKVAELASGYQGWLGAWKAFGADKFLTDDEIKDAILKWRADSPNIVEFWGGQLRQQGKQYKFKREFYGIEGTAIQAVLAPGSVFRCRHILFCKQGTTLFCKLPSGRKLAYHNAILVPTTDRYSKQTIWQLTYEGWNSDSQKGPVGWITFSTYGGKLVENITQAVARDIQAYSMLNLDAHGYPIVLHVHDEIVAEVHRNFGSIEEFEMLMSAVPEWARGWPVRASGGWRGRRYRK